MIGAIPGAGANVASFLAYDVGRRRATPEERAKWGKGSYEAIVCAQVAQNANIGGSMLPTLALGIPGNAPAAAFMAALMLKNVVVGPTIQIDHPGLIYFIYAALIVANFLMYGAAILLIKPCVKLFSLPRGLLLPLIIPICVIGAYAVRLSMLDVWIMFAAGLCGYVLQAFRFPLAPIVLGVILGAHGGREPAPGAVHLRRRAAGVRLHPVCRRRPARRRRRDLSRGRAAAAPRDLMDLERRGGMA